MAEGSFPDIYIKAIAFQGKIRSSLVPTPKPYRDILKSFCNSFCPRLPGATWPLSAIEDAHQGFQGESKCTKEHEGIDSGAGLALSAEGIGVQHTKGARQGVRRD